MVSDTEPRFRLVDGDGTVVGTLFAESDGTLKLQEGSSGNDNELSFTTQGALEVEQATVTSSTGFSLAVLGSKTGFGFDSGDSRTLKFNLGLSDMPVVATAVPDGDPGNDHGYVVDEIAYDKSDDAIAVTITETRNAGGGSADIYLWQINP